MRVVLNGLPINYPISGVGRYTLMLSRSLNDLIGEQNIFWFGERKIGENIGNQNSKHYLFLNRSIYLFKKLMRRVPYWRSLIFYCRNKQFQLHVRSVSPSLYHETNYALFDFDRGPTVITLYDLSFVKHPEWHPKDRVKYFEKYCLKKLSQVDAIITISEFSKKEIIELLGIDAKKIYVTYPGVDRKFMPEGERMKGLPNKYILFVGTLEPRKNLPTLLNAYRSLPKDLQEKYPLVISGAFGWYTDEFKKALRLLKGREKPILTGYVNQDDLPGLYRGASLFVYPSYYEGFGLPVIEAMASGVPVVTSNTTSLPEVVGETGLLVSPYDADALREAMIELIENEGLKRELLEKGITRAKQFSWKKCASETIEVYEKVLSTR